MTTTEQNKITIAKAVLKLTLDKGKEPEVSELEDYTGLNAITIIRNLGKDYPKHLLITEQTSFRIGRSILIFHKVEMVLGDWMWSRLVQA